MKPNINGHLPRIISGDRPFPIGSHSNVLHVFCPYDCCYSVFLWRQYIEGCASPRSSLPWGVMLIANTESVGLLLHERRCTHAGVISWQEKGMVNTVILNSRSYSYHVMVTLAYCCGSIPCTHS